MWLEPTIFRHDLRFLIFETFCLLKRFFKNAGGTPALRQVFRLNSDVPAELGNGSPPPVGLPQTPSAYWQDSQSGSVIEQAFGLAIEALIAVVEGPASDAFIPAGKWDES